MQNTPEIHEVWLSNLKILHGTATASGAPTSANLVAFLRQKNVHITEQELSNIYQRKSKIDIFLARKIESAFSVPEGWLSEDQSFFRTITPEDIAALKAYLMLPTTLKSSIKEVIHGLSRGNA